MAKADIAWSSGHPAIRHQLQSIRKKGKDHVLKKLPVTDRELVSMVRALPAHNRAQDLAILTVGWFTALRRSNVVRIEREHLRLDSRGFELSVPWSKTNQKGDDQRIAVWAQDNVDICPARALRAWLDESKIEHGRIFPVSEQYVSRLVKRGVKCLGLDPAGYGAHSLRAGLATTADREGCSLAAIMRQTLHKSERVASGYIRPPDLFEGNVTRGLIK